MGILVLLMVVVAGMALWGLVPTIVGLIKREGRTVCRGLARLCGLVAVGGYGYGLLMVELEASESSGGAGSWPPQACEQVGPMFAERVVEFKKSYLPLRFDCVLDDGTWYSGGVVPDGLMPVVLIAAAATVGLTVAARYGKGAGSTARSPRGAFRSASSGT
ncbi:hypothetical protein GCM10009534_21770 [Kribbella sandramycini]|uniref:Uncharacterized protein n=1 Tax=Kribbella sandramycini TaxID=60450 RepID=A0A841SHC2_9ACTN|nr:hypothetical protein [Kribbella sandramycini]